jgi:site-specific DNA-methyltransferase (adenine-specific)
MHYKTVLLDLQNVDCMELMAQYPDKHFLLAICDPPHGIGLANMNMGIGKSKKCSKAKNRKWKPKNWDNEVPTDKYFTELFRVSKNQIIWGGNYFNLPPCKNYVIWDKQMPQGLSFSDCEMAWTSFDKAPKIFRYSAYLDKQNKFHPTQKPVALYKWLLTNYAKQGDKILDTHLGSASIAIACHELKFELVGSELDSEYFQASIKRIENHIAQTTLF